MPPSSRRPVVRTLLVVGTATVGLMAAGAAMGATASGTGMAALTVNGPGLTQKATHATPAPATVAMIGGRRVDLPAMTVALSRAGRPTEVRLAGLVRLRSRVGGRVRTMALASPRLTLGARPRLTALIGGRRRAVLIARAGAAPPRLAARSARLGATAMVVAPGAGAVVQRRLGLPRPLAGRVATLRLSATWATAPAPAPTVPGVPPPGPTLPVTPSPPPVEGAPAGPEAPRPAGAVDIRSATLTWRVRDSFVQYLNGSPRPGDGVVPVAPAVGHPAEPGCTSTGAVNSAALTYRIELPFVAGWFNPADGRAALRFGGGVHFGHTAHSIDLTATDPDIELGGTDPRAVFHVAGTGGTAVGPGRATLLALARDPAPAACAVDPGPSGAHAPGGVPTADGGTHHVFERSVGLVPADAAGAVFAGFYSSGEPFGWMTITFATAPH